MELRHLRYFVAVAEELHFSRAAARLNIATPTLSAQIQALEASLGAQLFTRKTRSVALTHVGRRFLDEARATLRQADQAELVGRRAARGDLGSIALGCVLSAVFGGIVPRSVMSFRTTHPDVVIHTRSMVTIEQMKALLDGTLDVGVTIAPDRYPAGLTGFIVDRQPFWLAIPQDNPLATREEIEPGMLAGEPIVATVLENELAFWSNVRAITPTGMPMRIVSRVPDIFSVMASVAAGVGIGVITESLARLPLPGVVCRKLVNVTRSSDHAAVFRKNEGAQVINAFLASMKAKAVALGA
jgi:DNA-binding transcriptional LysR family regulator